MVRNISLSQYLDLKEKKIFQIFIFFLGDEYSYLDNETTWLHSLNVPVYLLRLTEDDFHIMDFAVHPKIIGTKNGKEVLEISGLPNLNFLRYKISQI